MILEEVVKELAAPATLEAPATVECRVLKEGDVLSKDLNLGVVLVDKNWVWIAVKEGVAVAAIVASPYHGAVFVGRVTNPSHDDRILVPLLRRFISDTTARGHTGLFTFLDNDVPAEKKMASILERAGGVVLPGLYVAAGMALPPKRKW